MPVESHVPIELATGDLRRILLSPFVSTSSDS